MTETHKQQHGQISEVVGEIKNLTGAIDRTLEAVAGYPVNFALVVWGDHMLNGFALCSNVSDHEAQEAIDTLSHAMQMRFAFEDACPAGAYSMN